MKEDKVIRKLLLKNMFWTFLIIVTIFIFFDLAIYNKVSSSLYNSVDSEILAITKQYENNNDKFENRGSNPAKIDSIGKPNNMNMNSKFSPRSMVVIRNADGTIKNESYLGQSNSDFLSSSNFDLNNIVLDKIQLVKINDSFNYRELVLKRLNDDGEVEYVQVLANVDGETQTIKNIVEILLIGSGIVILASLGASYIISKRTIKPIIRSWNKQVEFVQNASHELRTPLAIILGKQELLLQEPNKKVIQVSEDINLTLKEVRRLSKLVSELMLLARADSENLEIHKEEVDIDQLVKDTVEPYNAFANTQNKSIILDLKFNNKRMVDVNKFKQLLIILLDNAIKYTGEKDIITVATYSKDNKLVLEVNDTGIGISDEGMKYIFDRFYREDKARSRESGGTGLGLAIAKSIVSSHSGSIKVAHNEPKGTKFIVKI